MKRLTGFAPSYNPANSRNPDSDKRKIKIPFICCFTIKLLRASIQLDML